MSLINFTLIAACVVISTFAQLVLKSGANKIQATVASMDGQESLFTQALALANAHILVGLLMYAVGAMGWILVLTRVEVSSAYPLISLGFVLTLIFGHLVFGESINSSKLAGTAIIIVGCALIARA